MSGGAYPGLSLLLDGYFHEDFRAEHGSHESAARAFRGEASGQELHSAAASLVEFIAWAETVPVDEWQDALGALGGSWRPRSLGPLRDVLEVLGAPNPP